jgi:hypothetical protein
MTTLTLAAQADETAAPAPIRRRRPTRHTIALLALLTGTAVLCLGLTSGSLALVHGGAVAEVAVLVVANLAATVMRFLLLRGWVFSVRRR